MTIKTSTSFTQKALDSFWSDKLSSDQKITGRKLDEVSFKKKIIKKKTFIFY